MIGVLRAITVFVIGAFAFTILLFGARIAFVNFMGDSLYGLPELQMERMAKLFRHRPVSGAKVLVLGDSTATFSITAKHFSDMDSLATINSTSLESYFTLKNILDSGSRPVCVVFSGSLSWVANHDYFWPMFVAGDFYSDGNLDEIHEVTSKAGDPPGNSWGFGLRKFLYSNRLLDAYSMKRFQDTLVGPSWRSGHVRSFREFVWREKGSNPLADHKVFEGRTDLTFEREPALNSSEALYFRRFFDLLDSNRIPLYLVEVPFADSVPSAYATSYWQKFEATLAATRPGNPPRYTRIAPPAFPASEYLSAGHLDIDGVKRLEPYIRQAIAPCYQRGN